VGTSLERLDGVSDIKTNIAAHRAQVAFDPDRLTPGDSNPENSLRSGGCSASR